MKVSRGNPGRGAMVLVAALGLGAAIAANDPETIVGADSCGECHKAEVAVWQQTKHHTSFQGMHRSEEAKKISSAMEILRIKTDSLCATCHYTLAAPEGRVRAISGTSCESCHGGARDWVQVHNDYGGPDVTREQETAEHRTQRWVQVEKAGMIRPADIYRVAQNCFQCHTVPNEKLVNVGGHRAGSDFELVAWSQGENRHNYSASDGQTNGESAPERLRILYVAGRFLDLEHGLRGAARATEAKPYAEAMARRVQSAFENVEAIQAVAAAPEIQRMIDAVIAAMSRNADNTLTIGINKESEYTAAADAVREAAETYLDGQDGSSLAAVDKLIPGPDQYKGTALP